MYTRISHSVEAMQPLCERSQPSWPLGTVINWTMDRRQSYWGLRRVITQPLCEVVLGSYPELGQGVVVMNTQRGNAYWVTSCGSGGHWGFLVCRYARLVQLAGGGLQKAGEEHTNDFV